jgi:hypothetical protein
MNSIEIFHEEFLQSFLSASSADLCRVKYQICIVFSLAYIQHGSLLGRPFVQVL